MNHRRISKTACVTCNDFVALAEMWGIFDCELPFVSICCDAPQRVKHLIYSIICCEHDAIFLFACFDRLQLCINTSMLFYYVGFFKSSICVMDTEYSSNLRFL